MSYEDTNLMDLECVVDGLDQTVQDPIWESDAKVDTMRLAPDPNDEEPDAPDYVRTSSGMLAFFNDIIEIAKSYLESDQVTPNRPKVGRPLPTYDCPSDSWRGRSAQVDQSTNQPLLVKSPRRRKVTIVNQGPDTVYLSSTSAQGSGQPNQFPLRAVDAAIGFYPELTLTSMDDVYARCLAGATANVTFIEEFDL